ncbi:MAG: hypothetical protein JXB26_16150 [Candidatus Aminicenantes bacterium]|nr:hypothetical protein [Candidatus Aminicenantes bacterium]
MKSKTRVFSVLILALVPFLSAQVRVNGYLSFNYLKGQEDAVDSGGTFRDSRAGLIFSGELLEQRITYAAEASVSAEGDVSLIQALSAFNLADYFHLKMGLYVVPFGIYNTAHRPHQTMFVQPPLVMEFVMPDRWRDIGVLMEGKYRGIIYSAYIGNGLAEESSLADGQQFTDNNKNKALGGKIGISVGQGFQAAYSHYRGKYDKNNARSISLQGIDLSWVAETFVLRGEYIRGRLENPEGFSKAEVDGYYVNLSFELWGIRPVLGYQGLEYKDDYHGPGFSSGLGEGIEVSRSRWVLGAIYIPAENVLLKVEYDFNRTKGTDLKDNIFSVQVGLSF